jgi:GTPase SAR1 family protein
MQCLCGCTAVTPARMAESTLSAGSRHVCEEGKQLNREEIRDLFEAGADYVFETLARDPAITTGDLAPEQSARINEALDTLTAVALEWTAQNRNNPIPIRRNAE